MKNVDRELLDFLLELTKVFSKYKKEDLRRFRAILKNMRHKGKFEFVPIINDKRIGEQAKNKIIGGLPKVFLSKKWFPQNLDIDDFAKRHLGINIPNPEKKSRPELIGIVITKVAKLDSRELYNFNRVLNTVLVKVDAGEVDDFFLEWEKAIRDLKFK